MSAPLNSDNIKSRNKLTQVLNLILWIVPGLLTVIGMGYSIFEHYQHADNQGFPWPTLFAVLVLGVFGPGISWFVLHWAFAIAQAYIHSQDQLSKRAEELTTLNKLSIESSQTLQLDKRINTILDYTIDAMDASAGMVFITENQGNLLRLEAHKGISHGMASKEEILQPGECMCGQAVDSRQILFAEDVGDDPRCTSDVCICEGFRSVACAPLEAKGQLVGLLQLASPNHGHFSEDRHDFLAAAAAQISVSIENARLYDQVHVFNVELERKINKRTKELETARWALAEKARQLQRLLSESYRVQEDTQMRIAHDMHDGVTQIIIGALYETEAARNAILNNPEMAIENMDRAQKHLADVELEINRVIYDLHPPVLDMMGLVVAMKRYASTYHEVFKIICNVEVNGEKRRLSKESELSIYRIIQAALQNVSTHSNASKVVVAFDYSENEFSVNIADNGIGFDPKLQMKTPGEHLGLIGMKERAEGMGALLEVISAIRKGTSIELSITEPDYWDYK